MTLKEDIVWRWAGRTLVALAVGLVALYAWRIHGLPAAPPPADVPAPPPSAAAHLPGDAWTVFQPAPNAVSTAAAPSGPAPDANFRFRLAGTFFAFADAGTNATCRAILEDKQGGSQRVAGEGDDVEGWRVRSVLKDQVTLSSAAGTVVLKLSFTGGAVAAPASAGPAVAKTEGDDDDEGPALETNRFGKRVSENRWVLNREALMDYYKELLDQPERIASVYTSLKPAYRDDEISGYHLQQEGERDFFKAVGLQEGDIVRKVNSLNMTSQNRAEYFLGEFVKGRLSAVVLDIDRGEKQEKMIYLIR